MIFIVVGEQISGKHCLGFNTYVGGIIGAKNRYNCSDGIIQASFAGNLGPSRRIRK